MRTISLLAITISAILLAFSPAIASVYAICGTGNASDSWTPRAGVTFSITATACPGLNPHHTLTSSRTDSSLIPQNSNYTFQDLDNISPNTGLRVDQSFSTGVGVLPNVTKDYGPFSSPTTPNCGYTDFYILVLDSVTGQTHTLIAEGFGQTAGNCPR